MLTLQPTVFTILKGLVEDHCGLRYQAADRDLFESRVSPRAAELGFGSLLDYYYFVRYDPKGGGELDLLVEALVCHESYFFREAEQLSVLVETFLVPLVEAGARPRVWCAAAACGEEPYTLAILLGERKLLGRVEVVASDVSHAALAHAKAGLFNGRSERAVGGTVAGKWLEPCGDRVQVPETLQAAIDWRRLNLCDTEAVGALGQFDAIICRNVLCYFSDPTISRVVQTLTGALKSHSLLLVGASESLMRFGTALNCEERSGAFFYRKSD